MLAALLAALLVSGSVLPRAALGGGRTVQVDHTLPGNGQGDLVVVGDSLTEGAEFFGQMRRSLLATKVWPRVTVDYRRGRTVRQGIPVLRRRLAASAEPTAVIIALGTNDMMSHAEASWPAQVIDEIMRETIGLPVMWVNLTFDGRQHPEWRARAARFNRALVAAQARWSELTVVSWSRAFVPTGRSRFIADGVHLTVTGYRTRATWITARAVEFGRNVVYSSTTTTSTTSSTSSSTVPVTTSTAGGSTTTTSPG